MDEKMQQIIEDSEKIRDRNRDLESELHGLKVENERLKEENEALFATHGGANPQTLRDALKWLHDQGGIGAVYSRYKDVVLGETEEALEVKYSEDIEKRLMPEGMEWPRFEDGAPVKPGDIALINGEADMVEAVQLWIHGNPVIYGDNDWQQFKRGERVKRLAPKLLDADGAEIEVGDDLYSVEGGLKLHVGVIDTRNGKIATAEMYALDKWADPAMYTHHAPVLAADGKPLREGETVWSADSGTRYTVEKITDELIPIKCCSEMGFTASLHPSQLTHERPDSWERLEEDAGMQPHAYCVGHMLYGGEDEESTTPTNELFARDLVRRAKALAERDR